ncbi:MAG: pyridoxal phosphate-dependent aminotransferase [Planctomycetaceae bacterium]|nr:pyridoxal phosphate-dependent aminotransferase [Planctomycetaceae bacterium]
MSTHWLADRTRLFDSSGIRKVFDLAAKLKDPINLSIGQPDFDVPEPVRRAAINAIEHRKNGYALTQGMPVLLDRIQAEIDRQYGHADRQAFVTCGTSGALMLALLVLVNPGEEVIVFDPCFVMYDALSAVAGAKVVAVDTYPDFQIDLDRVAAAITPRTKAIIFNSPHNPTGAVADERVVRGLAELAARRNIVLISDEIYRAFCYDRPFVSPATYNPQTLVIDGFSKTYAVTGWRLGFAHGPSAVIREMIKLQQYSFVCAPQPAQWAGAAAMDVDMSPQIADYHRKRDRLLAGLSDRYEMGSPAGAFYMFPKSPWGTASEFVARAIEKYGLLVIPGNVFSRRDTHFRLSYAADDRTLDRGVEALRRLADDRP